MKGSWRGTCKCDRNQHKNHQDCRGKAKPPTLKLPNLKLPTLKRGYRLGLYGLTLFCSILSLSETVKSRLGNGGDIPVYVAAACGLLCSGYYLYGDLTAGIKHTVRDVRTRFLLADNICQDYRYRTILFTTGSFLANLFYGASNGVYGWVRHSAWLGTLAAYYVVLSVMRYGLVRHGWKERGMGEDPAEVAAGDRANVMDVGRIELLDGNHTNDKIKCQDQKNFKLEELRIYRNVGILLTLDTAVLLGAVILLVHNEGGKRYPEILIFAVAAYTFYKMIMSVVHMEKARRLKSPLLVAVRNIGYADALVSLLSLQTAMLASFGKGEVKPEIVNGMLGSAVCAIIFFVGISMIYWADRQKKLLLRDEG